MTHVNDLHLLVMQHRFGIFQFIFLLTADVYWGVTEVKGKAPLRFIYKLLYFVVLQNPKNKTHKKKDCL